MARDCTDDSNYLSNTTWYGFNGVEGIWSLWLKPHWAQDDNTNHTIFIGWNGSNLAGLWKWGDNKIYAGWVKGATDTRIVVTSANYTLNQEQWNHILFAYRKAQVIPPDVNWCYLFLNGAQIGAGEAGLETFEAPLTFRLGRDSSDGAPANCAFSHWFSTSNAMIDYNNLAKSSRFVAEMAKGAADPLAFNVAQVQEWYPIYGQFSPEPGVYGTGSGALTVNGTCPQVTGPPIWNYEDAAFGLDQVFTQSDEIVAAGGGPLVGWSAIVGIDILVGESPLVG